MTETDDALEGHAHPVEPVSDWTADWDHHDPRWTADPFPIWDDLRSRYPVAHTDRYNEGVWLPTRYADITAVAQNPDVFSSGHSGVAAGGTVPRPKFPPIHLDPPEHSPVRRSMLPFFSPKRIEAWRPHVQEICDGLIDGFAERTAAGDTIDAAADYAAHIPAATIAAILGIPTTDGHLFRRWIHGLELGDNDPDLRIRTVSEMGDYFGAKIAERRAEPGDDLISELLEVEIDGERFDDDILRRILALQLVAGIDTTWGVLGASLWHLATHPADRDELVSGRADLRTAIEEFLRSYASVSLWRTVTQPATIGETEVDAGDTVMMAFPAACRDPEMFDEADTVDIHRERNRHVAFGAGIHRCLGSNLARLELFVGLETWLRRIPEFTLAPGAEVTWAEGAIRGPRSIPIVVGRRD
ncbi:cytochrome P450 [Ilumatobacter sp.]|uniref:cytochrome P450 n=1 Tax=Ilumatobacter sp. TaxID=1967498 RepID=UPI003AF81D35